MSNSRDATIPGDIAHMPVLSSDTSTTPASPVRSRRNRAAAMPPARFWPELRSPIAGLWNGG
jgi:hypothetical protein